MLRERLWVKFVFIKNEQNRWIKKSDDKVNEISENEVKKQQAYILCYTKEKNYEIEELIRKEYERQAFLIEEKKPIEIEGISLYLVILFHIL